MSEESLKLEVRDFEPIGRASLDCICRSERYRQRKPQAEAFVGASRNLREIPGKRHSY